MKRTLRSDKGQTIPLFIVAAMALLFLAFALFAVGQAAVQRNSTQSAADAAALAAAQEAREEIKDELQRAILTGDLTAIADLLSGTTAEAPQACAQARRFAAKNKANVTSCAAVVGPPGYTVSVISQKPLGKTEVEGSENKRARTDATAVIEPRCSLSEVESEADTEAPQDPESSDDEGDDDKEPPAPIEFDCDGSFLSIDPGDLDLEIDIADFFSVHLRD